MNEQNKNHILKKIFFACKYFSIDDENYDLKYTT